MKLLVTGGAGFIGSHFSKVAANSGHEVVVYDNLSTGHKKFVKFGPFIEGDIRDTDLLEKSLKEHKVEGVIHFAAKALVGESMAHPELYFSNNTWGTASVLEAMDRAGVRNLVFSSSCATYGVVDKPIKETTPQNPVNPYGRSKLQSEEIAFDYQKLKGFNVAALRYFNVAGQDPEGEVYEDHQPETHIIPNVVKAIKEGRPFKIMGTDYPTPDGTCVRDYVYVLDLAKAHLAALEKIKTEGLLISNVGIGRGYSVKEVFQEVCRVFEKNPEAKEEPRRPGDPPSLVADGTFFKSWYQAPMAPLEQMLKSLL